MEDPKEKTEIVNQIDLLKEFLKLSDPLTTFLSKNFNPHTTIVITSEYSKITMDCMGGIPASKDILGTEQTIVTEQCDGQITIDQILESKGDK